MGRIVGAAVLILMTIGTIEAHAAPVCRPCMLGYLGWRIPCDKGLQSPVDFVGQRGVDCDNPALLAQFDCHEAAYCAIMGCGVSGCVNPRIYGDEALRRRSAAALAMVAVSR